MVVCLRNGNSGKDWGRVGEMVVKLQAVTDKQC